jgi:hypothetical protein
MLLDMHLELLHNAAQKWVCRRDQQYKMKLKTGTICRR